MTAMDSGLGCQTLLDAPTELNVDGSTITVDQAVLAVHGVYIAWGASDQLASSTAHPSSSSPPTPTAADPIAYDTPSMTSIPAVQSTSESTIESTSDSASASTLTTPPNLQPSSTPPSTVTVTAPNSPSNETPTPQALSTGAKAGIGAGVGFGGLAVIGVLAWLFIARRRKRQRQSYMYGQPAITDESQMATNKAHHISELSTEGGRSELSGVLPWVEVQSKSGRAELESR